MTILYDARRPVNPGRPFGAGILPPNVPTAHLPDRPYEPTPEEHAWWAAESARLDAARRRPRRPAWVFDRADRLRALIARARGIETYLLRERCDCGGRPDLTTAVDARRSVIARRIRRLCDAARAARRAARDLDYDAHAAESAALDALTAGLIPLDLADEIARTSLVGHDA